MNPAALATDPTTGQEDILITLKAGTSPALCTHDNARLVIDTTNSNLTTDGMIANTLTTDNSNVVIKLLNKDASNAVIDLNNPGTHLTRTKDSGEFKYNLIARYHVTGTATEGDFAGKLVFDVDNY